MGVRLLRMVPRGGASLTVNRRSLMQSLAADLWAQLGYEGCRELREALRVRMAEHRAAVTAARSEAGLSRPRAARKPTRNAETAALTSQLAGETSETMIYRLKVVERFRPDLLPPITAGTLKIWPAYRQALQERDRLAVLAAGSH